MTRIPHPAVLFFEDNHDNLYNFFIVVQVVRVVLNIHPLFVRTSRDGNTWRNMPDSPIEVSAPTLGVGVYQTTYTSTPSWAKLKDFVIYQAK